MGRGQGSTDTEAVHLTSGDLVFDPLDDVDALAGAGVRHHSVVPEPFPPRPQDVRLPQSVVPLVRNDPMSFEMTIGKHRVIETGVPFMLEVFCGSARLTASLRNVGFDAWDIDHDKGTLVG